MGTYSARVDLNVHQKLPSEKSFIPLKVLEISEYNEYGVLAIQERLSSRITTLGLLRSSVVMAILLWRSAIVGGRSGLVSSTFADVMLRLLHTLDSEVTRANLSRLFGRQ